MACTAAEDLTFKSHTHRRTVGLPSARPWKLALKALASADYIIGNALQLCNTKI